MLRRLAILLTLLVLGILFPGAALADDGPTAQSNATAIDTVWVLICAYLVFLMHAGFSLVEAGFTRAKNTVNIMMKNLLTLPLGVLLFFATGFGLAFGGDTGGFIGTSGFGLSNINDLDFGIPTMGFWFFQAVFCATAATIVSGAVAERIKFLAYILFTVIITAFTYPVVVHWVWSSDGWLFQKGFIDFAGSSVVHGVGGWSALIGAWLLGARIGKYGKNGEVRAIPGHNIALGTLGTLLLWLGWFGFNPGSTLSGTTADIAMIATTTMLAASAGTVGAMLVTWTRYGKPDLALTLNGALSGLVGVTAGCAAVSPVGAIVIGLISGVLLPLSVSFFDRVAKIDDPVGAISVHGVCGMFGTLAVGFFALDGGFFYGGGTALLAVQATGIVAILAWASIIGFAAFKIIGAAVGLRVSPEEEMEGLDIGEHGMEAYGDFMLRSSGAAGVVGLNHERTTAV
ncbi:ammonium transporter [Desulfoscipio sp. XC116]|uniref:ammonium transporter n=1 Tax=Desulfoscipio sp. XC116 TaxID=3144975 RepID=UPI00325AE5AA